MYCIDASVIVSSQLPEEIYFNQSRAFLEKIAKSGEKVFLPEIVIPEITSGLFREVKNTSFILEYTQTLRGIPNFLFIPIDSHLADLSSWVITKTGLRAADALYVGLAFYYKLILITLDKDQLNKSNKLIEAKFP